MPSGWSRRSLRSGLVGNLLSFSLRGRVSRADEGSGHPLLTPGGCFRPAGRSNLERLSRGRWPKKPRGGRLSDRGPCPTPVRPPLDSRSRVLPLTVSQSQNRGTQALKPEVRACGIRMARAVRSIYWPLFSGAIIAEQTKRILFFCADFRRSILGRVFFRQTRRHEDPQGQSRFFVILRAFVVKTVGFRLRGSRDGFLNTTGLAPHRGARGAWRSAAL